MFPDKFCSYLFCSLCMFIFVFGNYLDPLMNNFFRANFLLPVCGISGLFSLQSMYVKCEFCSHLHISALSAPRPHLLPVQLKQTLEVTSCFQI